jgi:curli production assembly/transport component CsgG
MVFRYIAVDELLQAEAGVTYNEPPQLAVRQAIELAVYNLILEGHAKNLWDFSDAAKAAPVVERYRQLRNGGISEDWSGGTLFEEMVNAEG